MTPQQVRVTVSHLSEEDPALSVLVQIQEVAQGGGKQIASLSLGHKSFMDVVRKAHDPTTFQSRFLSHVKGVVLREKLIADFFAKLGERKVTVEFSSTVPKALRTRALRELRPHLEGYTAQDRSKTTEAKVMSVRNMLGRVPDAEIAEKLGISRDKVRYWRAKWKIPAYDRHQQRRA